VPRERHPAARTCSPGISSLFRILRSSAGSASKRKRRNTTFIITKRRKNVDALAPLGTNEHKPFLEDAPFVIVIFAETYGVLPDGRKVRHYYTQESVGIATGILITAIHHAGLVSLTHTPSPMGFLNEILGRPPHERAFLILVVGYPAESATVPKITKKSLREIVTWI
jgi:iodotyrosine deiodinase